MLGRHEVGIAVIRASMWLQQDRAVPTSAATNREDDAATAWNRGELGKEMVTSETLVVILERNKLKISFRECASIYLVYDPPSTNAQNGNCTQTPAISPSICSRMRYDVEGCGYTSSSEVPTSHRASTSRGESELLESHCTSDHPYYRWG